MVIFLLGCSESFLGELDSCSRGTEEGREGGREEGLSRQKGSGPVDSATELEERVLFLSLVTPCRDLAILPFLRQEAELSSGSRSRGWGWRGRGRGAGVELTL